MPSLSIINVHKHNKEAASEPASDLADLMAHKQDTAVKYYRLTEKMEASVKAPQALHSTMRSKNKEESKDEESKDEEQADEDTQKTESNSPKLKVPWSSKEIQEIHNLFQEEIKQKKVTMGCVKERIKESEVLPSIDSRRVYDRIRTECRSPETQIDAPAALPTEKEELSDRVNRLFRSEVNTSSDIVPPTTLSQTTKALFSKEQVQLLHRLFPDMLKNSPISKKVILERLSSDSKGKEILKSMLLPQIVNRMKYERRQKREKQA